MTGSLLPSTMATSSLISDQLLAKRKCDYYANKVILAPMVRANSLPFRLVCLRMGADIVYTEELIDHRLQDCQRIENKLLGTTDFIDKHGKVTLRTCPEERGRVVVQLGSNSPDRALKAAKLVSSDVAGIDFNFGCPKGFSLKGGMGAAMLDKPEEIRFLLTYCVENLDIPVTCKIRLLPTLEATLKLVKLIESCGVSAIAVHGRTKEQRSREENNTEFLRAIAESLSIPMIANGGSMDIKTYEDIISFRNKTKASSVMIARAAMYNPSVFRPDNKLVPMKEVVEEFLKLAIRYENPVLNSKYSMSSFLQGAHYSRDFHQRFHPMRDYKTICDLFNLGEWYEIGQTINKLVMVG